MLADRAIRVPLFLLGIADYGFWRGSPGSCQGSGPTGVHGRDGTAEGVDFAPVGVAVGATVEPSGTALPAVRVVDGAADGGKGGRNLAAPPAPAASEALVTQVQIARQSVEGVKVVGAALIDLAVLPLGEMHRQRRSTGAQGALATTSISRGEPKCACVRILSRLGSLVPETR